jgi:hypothetical protein
MNPLPFVIGFHLQCYGHVLAIIEINDRSGPTINIYFFSFDFFFRVRRKTMLPGFEGNFPLFFFLLFLQSIIIYCLQNEALSESHH